MQLGKNTIIQTLLCISREDAYNYKKDIDNTNSKLNPSGITAMKESKVHVLAYEWLPESKKNIETALKSISDITFQNDPKSFQQEMNKKQFDVIFMNIRPENGATFNLLKKTHTQTPFTPIIVTSKTEKAELIVEAIKQGAYDFIATPFSPARIQLVVQKAIKQRELENELAYLRRKQDITYKFEDIIAETDNFKAILDNLKKFASTDSTMLITGNTGTGKSFLSG